MSAFDTSGSGYLSVGGQIRWWDNPLKCTHAQRNVCPQCAELTEDEAAAVAKHIANLRDKAVSDD